MAAMPKQTCRKQEQGTKQRSASKVMPTKRNGSARSHTKGHSTSANRASGQHRTNKRHQTTSASKVLIGSSPDGTALEQTRAYRPSKPNQRSAGRARDGQPTRALALNCNAVAVQRQRSSG